MELELEVYGHLCATATFRINGIEADSHDFGHQCDRGDDAEPYCCADMQFISTPPTDAILNKYGISADEYNSVCKKLEEELSFGGCHWCS